MQPTGFIPPRNSSRLHGSSLRELGATLDQERAASMADEGGTAGAITDAVAQEASLLQEASEALVRAARSGAFRRVWPWALLLGGAAFAVAAVAGWRRSRAHW